MFSPHYSTLVDHHVPGKNIIEWIVSYCTIKESMLNSHTIEGINEMKHIAESTTSKILIGSAFVGSTILAMYAMDSQFSSLSLANTVTVSTVVAMLVGRQFTLPINRVIGRITGQSSADVKRNEMSHKMTPEEQAALEAALELELGSSAPIKKFWDVSPYQDTDEGAQRYDFMQREYAERIDEENLIKQCKYWQMMLIACRRLQQSPSTPGYRKAYEKLFAAVKVSIEHKLVKEAFGTAVSTLVLAATHLDERSPLDLLPELKKYSNAQARGYNLHCQKMYLQAIREYQQGLHDPAANHPLLATLILESALVEDTRENTHQPQLSLVVQGLRCVEGLKDFAMNYPILSIRELQWCLTHTLHPDEDNYSLALGVDFGSKQEKIEALLARVSNDYLNRDSSGQIWVQSIKNLEPDGFIKEIGRFIPDNMQDDTIAAMRALFDSPPAQSARPS